MHHIFVPVWFLEESILRASDDPERPFEVKWSQKYNYVNLSMGAAIMFIEQAREEIHRQSIE